MDQQTKTDAIEGLQSRIDRRRLDLQNDLKNVVSGETSFTRWVAAQGVAGSLEDQVRAYAQHLQDDQRAIRDSVKSLNALGKEPVVP